MNCKKYSFWLCRANCSALSDINAKKINLLQTPFFSFSVNNSFSMKKMGKSTQQLPQFFNFTYVHRLSS